MTSNRLLLRLTVPGRPEPWRTYPRRSRKHAAEMRRYKAFKAWQTEVYFRALAARIGTSDGAVILNATFYVSLSHRVCDRSNLEKALADALQNTCYRNDSQVVGGEVRRVFDPNERTEIECWELAPEPARAEE